MPNELRIPSSTIGDARQVEQRLWKQVSTALQLSPVGGALAAGSTRRPLNNRMSRIVNRSAKRRLW